ncbi:MULTISPECIES: LURP-one-related/scramblase family protein [unclassified Corynebacterium]|uniref:LURP-one-related/scramblase family protein n=1 Tax=unclassified Corynebacterium TaxID=2624378 RepID=UPI0029CA0A2D|nr:MULTISPECIES: phospholipid scramblase-related protein [unclassified Corynebacterium]WPF66069.1 phospholipid scramblase-related protein [Corynebacterium sp. 22KM0430]WPF68561.1 phospholipid scramblase-related protein [Corynebacterium sp. 21KM1197]
MTENPDFSSLLHCDHLIMQQVTNWVSNDFDILNPEGQPVGRVVTSGSLLGRMMMGSRELLVTEVDETPVLRLSDTVNFLRETMDLFYPDGTPLAHLRQRWSFFRSRVDMHLADGRVVELHGSVWDYNYQFVVDEQEVVRVSREWGGIGRALMGHSRYHVEFAPGLPEELHATVLGGVIALDLLREKQRSS